MEKTDRRVYLRLTNRCNRLCSFCYYANDPKPYGEMTVDMVRDIIEKELEMHVEDRYLRVILSGGEPTLCAELEPILSYLNTLTLAHVVLETNCTNVDTPEFIQILNYFKRKHFLKLSIYSELMTPEYCEKLVTFVQLAKQMGIRYLLNPRFKNEEDKLLLKDFIESNNLAPDYGEVYYYPIYDCNLYRDGSLPTYDFSFITYDYDGSVLVWHQHTSTEV